MTKYLYIVRSDQLANALAAFRNIITENIAIELYQVDAKQQKVLFQFYNHRILSTTEEQLLNLYGLVGLSNFHGHD